MFLSAPASAGLDEFFMRFGAAAAQIKHRNIERLVPPGFPLIAHQAVYRFRPDQGQQPISSIYQVGPGLFTANAVPPYESWRTFEPIVSDGVKALLGARPAAEADMPFSGISLRYIDVFDQVFTQGRDLPTFLSEVLGISIGLPVALSEHIAPGSSYKPVLQLNIPMADGFTFGMVYGEGVAGGRQGFVLETSLSTAQLVSPSAEAVMAKFNHFHEVIHKAFVGLTKPLHDLMPPEARQ
jgi:uncharacterized protein (TIGR04255 family)